MPIGTPDWKHPRNLTQLAKLMIDIASGEARLVFVRVHKTLRTTPAMAAGVTKRLWEIGDVTGHAKGVGSQGSSLSVLYGS